MRCATWSVWASGLPSRDGARESVRTPTTFAMDGTPIAPVQVSDAFGWNATFGMHRADLVSLLAASLPAGIVNTGHRAIGFEQTGDVARVKFANGATAEADVVVAAD